MKYKEALQIKEALYSVQGSAYQVINLPEYNIHFSGFCVDEETYNLLKKNTDVSFKYSYDFGDGEEVVIDGMVFPFEFVIFKDKHYIGVGQDENVARNEIAHSIFHIEMITMNYAFKKGFWRGNK